MDNEYYVYEWIRLDTNEPFYIGKGKGKRCYKLTRGDNEHFNNIVKSIPVAVNILHDNLEERVAYDLEVWYIREYRDIIGYDMCNICDGGEGITLIGKYTSCAKAVICITTNKIFDTARDGAKFYKCDESQLSKCCRNEQHSAGKLNDEKLVWMWLEDYNNATKEEIQNKINESKKKTYYKNNKHPRSTKIICLTTNKIFDTIKEASKFYNANDSSIVNCLKNNQKSAGKLCDGTKLTWMYLDDYKKATEEEIQEKLKITNNKKKKKIKKDNRVICITTGEIFNSGIEASKYYNIDSSGINKVCRKERKSCGKLPDGTKLVWMWLKDYEAGKQKIL